MNVRWGDARRGRKGEERTVFKRYKVGGEKVVHWGSES